MENKIILNECEHGIKLDSWCGLCERTKAFQEVLDMIQIRKKNQDKIQMDKNVSDETMIRAFHKYSECQYIQNRIKEKMKS